MDLNLYKLFLAVVEQQNITRAAAQVGMTQPAASNALQRLRQQLGDPLFVRTRTGMVPTDYAKQIEPEITQALTALIGVKSLVPPSPTPISGLTKRIRIVMSDLEEQLFLDRMSGALMDQNDRLPVEVLPQHRVNLETGFRDNLFDLAVMFIQDPLRNIQSRDLVDVKFSCISAKNHPLIKDGMTMNAYLKVNHLLVAPGTGGMTGWVDKELQKIKLKRHVSLSVPHFFIAGELVSNTGLVATLPDKLAKKLATLYPLTLHEPPLKMPGFTIGMHWHISRDRDPEHTAFRNWFASLFTE